MGIDRLAFGNSLTCCPTFRKNFTVGLPVSLLLLQRFDRCNRPVHILHLCRVARHWGSPDYLTSRFMLLLGALKGLTSYFARDLTPQ